MNRTRRVTGKGKISVKPDNIDMTDTVTVVWSLSDYI